MKKIKLLLFFIIFSFFACSSIQNQEETIKEKKQHTDFICSYYADFFKLEKECYQKDRNSQDFEECMSDLRKYQIYLQKLTYNYEKNFEEKFNWNKCTSNIKKKKR